MYSTKLIQSNIKPTISYYSHSVEAQEFIAKNESGLVEWATGVGKNHLMGTVSTLFRELRRKIQVQVYVGHRILLVNDNIKTFRDASLQVGNANFNTIIVNSSNEKISRSHLTKEEKAQLSYCEDHAICKYDNLRSQLENAIKYDKDLFIGVTYHSLSKLTNVCKELGITIDIAYLDEIHSATSNEEHFKDLQNFVNISNRTYGFTATPGEKGGRINDRIISLLGDKAHTISIHDAIKKGLIVKPRWMITAVEGTRKSNLGKGVLKAFNKLQDEMVINNKALVHCKSKAEVNAVTKFIKDFGDSSITVASIVSTYKDEKGVPQAHEITCNGKVITAKKRQDWLDFIKDVDGKLIVLHCEICNTGIDIPGFTQNIWAYFSKSGIKTIQGNGRGARLYFEDRIKLEQGLISPSDLSDWVKPYNTVTLLMFMEDPIEDEMEMIDLIVSSREQGFEISDTIKQVVGEGKEKSAFETDYPAKMRLTNMFVIINTRIESESNFIEIETYFNNVTIKEPVNF